MIPSQGFCVHFHTVTITAYFLRDSLYLSDKYSFNGSVRVSVELDLPRSVNYVSIFLSTSFLRIKLLTLLTNSGSNLRFFFKSQEQICE